MSQAHIVIGHPNAHSYNAFLATVASEELTRQGWGVTVTDLHASGFDPREGAEHYGPRDEPGSYNVQREQRLAAEEGRIPREVHGEIARMEEADLVILQFPLWWFGPPAILKGWFDRVFVYGKLYTSTMRHDRGIFRGKRAMLSVTCGGPRETFGPEGRNGDIDALLWPMNFSLSYLGFTVLQPEVLYGVQAEMAAKPSDELARHMARNTDTLRQRMRSIESSPTMRFNRWDDWEAGRLKPGVEGCSPVMRARGEAVQESSLGGASDWTVLQRRT
jgi:NAD(P)H dehydrogenase (quinone)